MGSSHLMVSSQSTSKDPIQETFSFIWDSQHRKGKFHLDTEKQLHASRKKKWSRLRLSDLGDEFIRFPYFQPFPKPFFLEAFPKPTDVPMFFDKVKWIVLTQHGGFTRMPSSCGKKSHRNPALRTEVPRSMLWWRRWNQPFPRSTPWAEKTLEWTVNLFLSSRWSCLQRLLQVNERFSGTLDENQGSTCCFSTPKFPTRWFAIPDLNWSDSDLWEKSFHITIKHVRLKKSLYRWFMTRWRLVTKVPCKT